MNFAAPTRSYLVRFPDCSGWIIDAASADLAACKFFDDGRRDGVTAPRVVEVSENAGRSWSQWTCRFVEGNCVCLGSGEALPLRAAALVDAAVEDMPEQWQQWASDPEGNTRSLLLAVAVMILKAQELDL